MAAGARTGDEDRVLDVRDRKPDRGYGEFPLSRAFFNRGTAYARIGLMKRALADYDRAVAADPRFAKAYNNAGYSAGRPVTAMERSPITTGPSRFLRRFSKPIITAE